MCVDIFIWVVFGFKGFCYKQVWVIANPPALFGHQGSNHGLKVLNAQTPQGFGEGQFLPINHMKFFLTRVMIPPKGIYDGVKLFENCFGSFEHWKGVYGDGVEDWFNKSKSVYLWQKLGSPTLEFASDFVNEVLEIPCSIPSEFKIDAQVFPRLFKKYDT